MKKILAVLGLIFVDQISKFLVLKYYPNIVSSNSGGAFSILQGYQHYYVVVIVLIALIIGAMVFYKNLRLWPLFLIVGGAFSNLIDRLFRSFVVDFINLRFFFSFNIADIAITVGLLWLLLTNIFEVSKSSKS